MFVHNNRQRYFRKEDGHPYLSACACYVLRHERTAKKIRTCGPTASVRKPTKNIGPFNHTEQLMAPNNGSALNI